MEIPCKSIQVPGNINGMGTDASSGLLAFLGYSCAAGGPAHLQRQKILRDAFCAELVGLTEQNATYLAEFGPPGSFKRFEKIRHIVDGRIRSVDTQLDRTFSQAWLNVSEKHIADYNWFVVNIGPIVGVEAVEE